MQQLTGSSPPVCAITMPISGASWDEISYQPRTALVPPQGPQHHKGKPMHVSLELLLRGHATVKPHKQMLLHAILACCLTFLDQRDPSHLDKLKVMQRIF